MYEASIFPRLRKLVNMPNASTEEMFKVADYLYWAKNSSLPLKFELNDDEMNWITAACDRKVWAHHWAHVDEKLPLVAYEFMQHLLEFSQVLKGDDWKSKPFFNKYFKGSVFPKFAFFPTHENNIYPIFQIFDHFRI